MDRHARHLAGLSGHRNLLAGWQSGYIRFPYPLSD
jgi:hypothetical protein